VGRLTPEVADDRTLRRLFHVGIATSVAAVLERLFVAPEFLVLIGAKTYYQEFLGVEEFTQGNEYGLVDNYWTLIGGHLVPRAGSVYLNSMNFAIAFVLVIPAATLWLLSRQDRRPMRSWLGYAVAWAGLLLTITRMSIVTAALEVLLIAVVLKRPGLLTGLAATGTAAFAAGLVLVPNMAGFVWETLTWQTGSSTAHLDTWSRGLNTLATHPLGMGLATADAGIRFGLTPVSADNLYLKYGAEQGVLGLASLVAMLATIGWTAWKLSQSDAPPAQRRFGVFVLVATLGIAVNGLTITILTTQMLSYLFFWTAGSTVTLAQRTSPSRVG
jgi:O-antigen ligase